MNIAGRGHGKTGRAYCAVYKQCCQKEKTVIDFGGVLHGDNAPILVFAVLLSTVRTLHTCHPFAGHLTSRSFLDVEPREVILWYVLAPAAAVRDNKRLLVARVAYRLQRILALCHLAFLRRFFFCCSQS